VSLGQHPLPLLPQRFYGEGGELMIVAVGNQKGGVGKTMLAGNLAAAWARQRRRVALVGSDPQASAADWLTDEAEIEAIRHPGPGLPALLELLVPRYDVVIVDTPPGLSRPLREAILAADIFVIPLPPSPYDVRAVRATLELAKVLRGDALTVRLVLNRLCAGTVLAQTAREGVAGYGVRVLRAATGERIALEEAGGLGTIDLCVCLGFDGCRGV
jgi:chromosome partitioning protein